MLFRSLVDGSLLNIEQKDYIDDKSYYTAIIQHVFGKQLETPCMFSKIKSLISPNFR